MTLPLIEYEILKNGEQDFNEEISTLADLLAQIPSFLAPRIKAIPPDFIILDLLSKNEFSHTYVDFKWDCEKFVINKTVLQALETELIKRGYRKFEIPNWVVDSETWDAFKMEILRDIPHEVYLPLSRKMKEVDTRLMALNTIRNADFFSCYRESQKLNGEYMNLLEQYPIKKEFLNLDDD